MQHIVLDSSPASLLANPNMIGEVWEIEQWSKACLAAGNLLYLPEIIDYEVRRELIRAGKTRSPAKLNLLKTFLQYIPLNTEIMLAAANLWASVRNSGLTTAPSGELDVILAAQAQSFFVPPGDIVLIATSNPAHLSRFVQAEWWRGITP